MANRPLQLSRAQSRFLNSTREQKLFFGGRQVGKTEVLVRDALEHAVDGNTVALTAPTNQMNRIAFERLREIASDVPYTGRVIEMLETEVVFVGGGRVRSEWVDRLTPGGRVMAEKGTLSELDHLCVDEADYVDHAQLDGLIDVCRNRLDITVSLVGTPVPENSIFPSLIQMGRTAESWYVVRDHPRNVEFVDDETVDEIERSLPPMSAVVEARGMFVQSLDDFCHYHPDE